MDPQLLTLVATGATIGLLHTLMGPDHYLPFIVLSRSEGWPLRKTLLWTFFCGLGHVLSSVVVGAIGIALGWAVSGMALFESIRGNIAAYALIGFGGLYFLWGLWLARSGRHHHHHRHPDGTVHAHPHSHSEQEKEEPHPQLHDDEQHLRAHRRTVWTLFIIFVLGPCEPLIPLLMAPAARHSAAGVALVAGVFSAVTIATMLIIVAIGASGLKQIKLGAGERHAHAMAGLTLLLSGLAIQLLGL